MSPSPIEPESETTPPVISYRIPIATTFKDVHENLETLSKLVETLAEAMHQNTKASNENLAKLAEETNASFEKLSSDLKTVFSSQAIIYTICIIVICFVILTFKGVYEFLALKDVF